MFAPLTCSLLICYQKVNNVRGIFLDMSKLKKSIHLESSIFINMVNLRYLKIYDSCCARKCIPNRKLYLYNGIKFPLKEVRCLHWVQFPLEEIPIDFKPENLVDLRLPYSKIERIWKGVKVCYPCPFSCCYFFFH